MTVSIKVSVNGNYKLPVTVQRPGAEDETFTVSGRRAAGDEGSGPVVRDISYYHGANAGLTVILGQEEPDNGEPAEG